MTAMNARVSSLVAEAVEGRLSRRDVIRRGIALGMSASAIASALTRVPAAARAAQNEPVKVSILNKEMTHDEIVAEIQKEGEVNVGNWTYTANDTLIAKFKQYVKDTYGVDVGLNYEASQAPSTYITNLYTALQSGSAPSYDVMAIEENYWAEAMSQPEPVAEEFLPSGLVPNAERVLDMFNHAPTAVGFQASATPGIVYDKERASFITDWTDLADERLKQRLTMPLPGDITAGGMLLGLAEALKLDYKKPEEMTQAIDFAIQKIHPNVLQYTTDSATMQQLLRAGVVDAVGFWDSLGRMEFLNGQTNTAFLFAKSGQYLVNGYMWIPKGTQHPVLAQIFADWRLSDEAQFPPESWGLEHGPWAELNEGVLGESYVDLVPDWFKDDYFNFYPTIEQLTTNFKTVDWDYYAEHVGEWMDYYAKGIGQ
ncbi:MAG: extracellular solute-binding protein [Thermomicrobiales bacterium]|nr:extracellular solute-binding protein [Thermomicrobiales bacterium]